MIPAVIAGVLLNDVIESNVRQPGLVALLLVVGAAILWFADRTGRQDRRIADLTFGGALGIGVAQALALFPGISRSGISISAGRLLGLSRPEAARFSFLMATPIIAGAGAWEALKLIRGGSDVPIALGPLVVGMVAALLSGLLAIHFLLRYLTSHRLNVFVVYRLIVAAVVVIWFLAP